MTEKPKPGPRLWPMLSEPGPPWAWAGWRPIVTAPRNVLIVGARYDDAQPVSWAENGWRHEEGHLYPADYFTHWMPFPPKD